MLLNLITGGPGSGKSRHLYELIRKNLKNNPGSRAVLIVPEQFSYNAERALSKEMGGLGINRVDVLTFSRLAKAQKSDSPTLLAPGKMLLVCRAANEISEKNIFYSSTEKTGFLTSLCELFSEFRRYEINPDDLEQTVSDDIRYSNKINSVNEIYKQYLNYASDFYDSDDSLELFADFAEKSGKFSNTFFFIDDYSDFLPQHCSVIRSLLVSSRGVHITLGIADDDGDGLFAPVIKTENKLRAIAHSADVPIYTKRLDGFLPSSKGDIVHLLKNWETHSVYDGNCENISIFAARDLYSETEHTASEIISLVRDKGCRFRDIGVICGDIDKYLHLINAIFTDYNIPFFADEKLAVIEHPIARTILSLFNILIENWSIPTVFDYLRSGYIYIKTDNEISPISPEDVDTLENYVIAHGIKGKKAWFSRWTDNSETIFDDVIDNYRCEEYDLDKLNALRELIIAPFEQFLANRGRTVKALCSAVYDFMCNINLYEGITSECEKFDRLGLRNESEQFRQVWNSVLSVLDQMVITSGKGAVSRETFAVYFKNALAQCSISIIPSGLDRVSVGTVERNSPSRVKHLFIIGATYGVIPPSPACGNILTDYDRSMLISSLSENGKEIAPNNVNRTALENLKLFRILCTAGETVRISYPSSGPDGSSLMPSPIIGRIAKMFPDIKISDNVLCSPDDSELLASAKHGFCYMLSKLSEYNRENPSAVWQSVYNWYAERPQYADKLEILSAAARYKKLRPRLMRTRAELLYGKNKKYSISALEKFSRCPFSYYLEKGLKARPRDEKRIEKSHLGSLIHAAICEFCKAVENGADTLSEIHRRWCALTDEDCREIIQSVMDIMREKILARVNDGRKQTEYLLSRCERTLMLSASTIRNSLSAGGYTSICCEKDFEVQIDWHGDSITLRGTIDRIDLMEDVAENKANIRVIDYKSGKKKFSIAAICNKLDMQLALYAVAAVNMYSNGSFDKTSSCLTPQISAVMYNKINDDIISLPENDKTLAKREHNKRRKLDGLIILDEARDEDGNSLLLPDNALEMDHSLADGKTSSDFLNVTFKSDGSFSKTAQIASRSDFNAISDYIKKTAVSIDKSITDGNINIYPCRSGGSTACTYCDFKEVCLFDSAFDKYRSTVTGEENAMNIIRKEMSEDEQNQLD